MSDFSKLMSKTIRTWSRNPITINSIRWVYEYAPDLYNNKINVEQINLWNSIARVYNYWCM